MTLSRSPLAALAAVLFLATSLFAAEAPWSDSTFESRALQQLQQRFPGAKFERLGGPEEIAFKMTNGPKVNLEISLEKTRAHCRADWTLCPAAVEQNLKSIEEMFKEPPTSAEQLRIALRSSFKLAQVEERAKGSVVKPFSAETRWTLVADRPNTIQLGVHGSAVGMTDDAAWSRAHDNLAAQLTSMVSEANESFIVLQGDYAPSAMLFPERMLAAAKQHFPNKAAGHLLAIAPEENIVLYTLGGADDAALLGRAAHAGSEGSLILLPSQVMEWDGQAWKQAK